MNLWRTAYYSGKCKSTQLAGNRVDNCCHELPSFRSYTHRDSHILHIHLLDFNLTVPRFHKTACLLLVTSNARFREPRPGRGQVSYARCSIRQIPPGPEDAEDDLIRQGTVADNEGRLPGKQRQLALLSGGLRVWICQASGTNDLSGN